MAAKQISNKIITPSPTLNPDAQSAAAQRAANNAAEKEERTHAANLTGSFSEREAGPSGPLPSRGGKRHKKHTRRHKKQKRTRRHRKH